MQLKHSFAVPVSVEEAWRTLLDIERVAPCMPGATLTGVEGDIFTGAVQVKVGPISLTYGGQARLLERDDEAHNMRIDARGKETRGSGTARATVRAALIDCGDSTQVDIVTDLAITGKPAQFGRGVLADVGGKLIGQFADCLSRELAVGRQPIMQTAAPSAAPQLQPQPQLRRAAEPIDLLGTAGSAAAKRLAPVLAIVLVVLAVLLRRRCQARHDPAARGDPMTHREGLRAEFDRQRVADGETQPSQACCST